MLSLHWLVGLDLGSGISEDCIWAGSVSFNVGHYLLPSLLDFLVFLLELLHLVEASLGFLLPIWFNLAAEVVQTMVQHLESHWRVVLSQHFISFGSCFLLVFWNSVCGFL